jgi:hypothetical protein
VVRGNSVIGSSPLRLKPQAGMGNPLKDSAGKH